MTEKQGYRATAEQWERIMREGTEFDVWQAAALLELRSRIEELTARIESVNLEARLQRDFKFLLDRIEALEKHWHYPDSDPLGATDPPSFPTSEAGPAPSQTAETTTEWETHQHDLLRWKAQGWKVEPIAGATRADVEWCQTCGALSIASGNFNFPKSTP